MMSAHDGCRLLCRDREKSTTRNLRSRILHVRVGCDMDPYSFFILHVSIIQVETYGSNNAYSKSSSWYKAKGCAPLFFEENRADISVYRALHFRFGATAGDLMYPSECFKNSIDIFESLLE